jgi:ribonuclease VapC
VIVLDTSAIYALLIKEPEADQMEAIIGSAPRRILSAFTAFETRTVIWRRFGLRYVGYVEDFLRDIDAELHPFDARQSDLASVAYRKYGKGSGHRANLNLGDCPAYALATSLDLPLLYKGNDFRHTDVRSALA